MLRPGLIVLIALLLSSLALAAEGQQVSDSYLTLEIEDDRIDGQWALALRDLEYILGLDENHDGAISWGELRQRQSDIAAYALGRLELRRGHSTCDLELRGQSVDHRQGAVHTVLSFSSQCPVSAASQPLTLTYDLFFDRDPTHRGLLRVMGDGREAFRVLRPSAACVVVASGSTTPWNRMFSSVAQVLWPLLMGTGLLLLLLSGSLVRVEADWKIVESSSSLWQRGLTACLAFAVVHGLSCLAAAAGWISLPSLWLELSLAGLLAAGLFDSKSCLRKRTQRSQRQPQRTRETIDRRSRRSRRALTGSLTGFPEWFPEWFPDWGAVDGDRCFSLAISRSLLFRSRDFQITPAPPPACEGERGRWCVRRQASIKESAASSAPERRRRDRCGSGN